MLVEITGKKPDYKFNWRIVGGTDLLPNRDINRFSIKLDDI
jgi:hypothetical protein